MMFGRMGRRSTETKLVTTSSNSAKRPHLFKAVASESNMYSLSEQVEEINDRPQEPTTPGDNKTANTLRFWSDTPPYSHVVTLIQYFTLQDMTLSRRFMD